MKATCSVDNCETYAASRGWCAGHLARWRRHGDVRAHIPMQKKNQPCKVDNCERKAVGRGWCNGHYTRMRRTGETGIVAIWDRKKTACVIDTCDRVAYALGLCSMHWQRAHTYGDPLHKPMPKDGPESARWLSRESLNYDAAHDRVKRYRGSPSSYLCNCGSQAVDWAYQHSEASPLHDERGRPFSDDIWRYMAMCRHCHKTFDMQRPRA